MRLAVLLLAVLAVGLAVGVPHAEASEPVRIDVLTADPVEGDAVTVQVSGVADEGTALRLGALDDQGECVASTEWPVSGTFLETGEVELPVGGRDLVCAWVGDQQPTLALVEVRPPRGRLTIAVPRRVAVWRTFRIRVSGWLERPARVDLSLVSGSCARPLTSLRLRGVAASSGVRFRRLAQIVGPGRVRVCATAVSPSGTVVARAGADVRAVLRWAWPGWCPRFCE